MNFKHCYTSFLALAMYSKKKNMKKRTKGFLRDELISHESEKFDYIAELHDYLWKFVRCELPAASGKLQDYLDIALKNAQHRARANEV